MKWLLVILGIYLSTILLAYLFQKRLLFFPDQTPFDQCSAVIEAGGSAQTIHKTIDKNIRYYRIPSKQAQARGSIIHFHGNGGRACDRFQFLKDFTTKGFDLILAEYPGYAEDRANPSLPEILEASYSLFKHIVAATPPGQSIFLYGESLGSAVATYVASKAESSVNGLILQAPFPSVAEVGQFHYSFLPVKWLLHHAVPAKKWAQLVKVPVFAFHGREDDIVPLKFGRQQIKNFATSKKFLWEVDGASHNDIITRAGDELWLKLESFLAGKLDVQKLEPPVIIAHRGASGYRPEHTLEAYQLAIEQGADFIEPDLVITKDKVLIARHENEISLTTDVQEKFPERKTTKTINGQFVTGWFSEDFTLDEIKKLRAVERLSTRDQSFNGCCEIPTLAEIIKLVKENNQESARRISIYPETKHPSYFSSIGLALEPVLIEELKKVSWLEVDSPVMVQSFELQSLKQLHKKSRLRLVLLFYKYDTLLQSKELKTLSEILYGIGPHKKLLLDHSDLIENAHAAGLKVHAYTFRSDPHFLGKTYGGMPEQEYLRFFKLGVDGVFTDFPDHAVRARAKFTLESPNY